MNQRLIERARRQSASSAEGRKVCWLLPKDTPVELPEGFGWAAHARQFPLAEDWPAAVVTASAWSPEVVPLIRAVVLVASVHTHVTAESSPLLAYIVAMQVRRPEFFSFNEKTRLTVRPMQRWSGEVWAAPIKIIDPKAASRHYLGAFLRPRAALTGEDLACSSE